ncbi:MAG: hypothetical protein ACREV0_13040 [Burkholderiales bacterium]
MNTIKDSDQTGAESGEPIPFAGATLGEYRHVCAFFSSSNGQYRVLFPFIKEGFERGEKALRRQSQAAP